MRKGVMGLLYLFLLLILGIPSVDALTEQDVPIIAYPYNRKEKQTGQVALCSMIKNEASYLKEWIEFHRVIGVSHFYLFNNKSNDDYLEVLQPYIKQGVVELFDVPFDSTLYPNPAPTHNFVQACCYNHAIRLARNCYTWLAITDSDEYICPTQNKDLPSFLNNYIYAAGLVVYWQIYGTSNVWDLAPKELLIEKLTYKFPNNYPANWMFKSIVQPNYALCIDPHCCVYAGDTFAVTPNHQRFSHTPAFTDLPVDQIRIAHYYYRTARFYQEIKRPRRLAWGFNPSESEENYTHELSNSVYDPTMLQFVPELRKRMFKD